MGDWGGDNEPNNENVLIQESIENNQAEIGEKRQKLYEKRLDIVKSQGAQLWTGRDPSMNRAGAKPRQQTTSEKISSSIRPILESGGSLPSAAYEYLGIVNAGKGKT